MINFIDINNMHKAFMGVPEYRKCVVRHGAVGLEGIWTVKAE